MKCPSCGLDVADGANFCGHCGNAVTVQGKVAGARTTSAAATDPAENYYMAPPPDESQERVLWDEYPSMKTAIPGIVLWVVAGVVIIVGLSSIPFTGSQVVQYGIAAVVALIVLAVLIRYYIRYHSTKYRLSSQRLFVTHGLLNKRTDEVELEKYKDIFVNQDFWDKIVGCGDIEVVTGDTTHPTVKITDISDPVSKKETIRSAARERKSGLGITRREEL